jgi:hypothetical protein
MGTSPSQNLMDLHGLLQGYFYFLPYFTQTKYRSMGKISESKLLLFPFTLLPTPLLIED